MQQGYPRAQRYAELRDLAAEPYRAEEDLLSLRLGQRQRVHNWVRDAGSAVFLDPRSALIFVHLWIGSLSWGDREEEQRDKQGERQADTPSGPVHHVSLQ